MKRTVFGNVSAQDFVSLQKRLDELERYTWDLYRQHRDLGEQYSALKVKETAARNDLAEAQKRYADLEAKDAVALGALAAARKSIADLESADRAREERLAAALGDARAAAEGLDFAATELAALVLPGREDEEKHIEPLLRRLFPRTIQGVDVSYSELIAPPLVATLRDAPEGRHTWESGALTAAGERSLNASGALVNDTVVLVRYAPEVFTDGDLPAVVENICHALAATLAARRRARSRAGDRGPVTMLAGEMALRRLRALFESQGRKAVEVSLALDEQLRDEQVGIYGEPAWNAIMFDCAGQLDRLVRELGGEVFETDGALRCLVPSAAAEAVQRNALAIAQALGLQANVAVS